MADVCKPRTEGGVLSKDCQGGTHGLCWGTATDPATGRLVECDCRNGCQAQRETF